MSETGDITRPMQKLDMVNHHYTKPIVAAGVSHLTICAEDEVAPGVSKHVAFPPPPSNSDPVVRTLLLGTGAVVIVSLLVKSLCSNSNQNRYHNQAVVSRWLNAVRN